MVLFLFPLVGHLGWLQGGGQGPFAADCAVSTGVGAGSGRHLAAASDFTASAVILLDLAIVCLTFSEANRIHSTSLQRRKDLMLGALWREGMKVGGNELF